MKKSKRLAWLALLAGGVAILPACPIVAVAGPGATLYEDAEDGGTTGWDIYDASPAGAAVTNVFDSELGSRVIELTGTARGNGFRLRNADGTPWANGRQFLIEWRMRFDEPYRIFIDVETTAGRRLLTYEAVDVDGSLSGIYVHHGLGSNTDDGSWVTIRRDLRADLADGEPGVAILEVNAMLVRGTGRLDDVRLRAPVPAEVYEDAEDGSTTGWDIYDASPGGASILNVFDSARGSRVIELTGESRANGFRLRNADLAPWSNTSQYFIEWSMRFDAPYRIFIDVETTAGRRYLTYEPVDIDELSSGGQIHHGLGSGTDDGGWVTISRDLQADLADGEPSIAIVAVNAMLVRGSGRLDDIRTRAVAPATAYEDAEDASTAGWDIYDASPGGASVDNVFDSERGSRVIELTGTSRANGFRLRHADLSHWENDAQFVAEWSMRFDAPYRIFIDVETTAGRRYLTYEAVDIDELSSGGQIHHGLGSGTDDGGWVTISRDLQADLADGEPGVAIVAVNAFLIRGSGRVDDIRLRFTPDFGDLDAVGDGGLVALSWSAPPGVAVDGYDVRRRNDGSPPRDPSDGVLIAKLPGWQHAVIDSFAQSGGLGDSAHYSVFWRSGGSLHHLGASAGMYCDGPDCITVPDLRKLTRVKSIGDVNSRRAALIEAIWGVDTLPAQMPVAVTQLEQDPTEGNKRDYRPPNAVMTEELTVDPGDPLFVSDFAMRLYSPNAPNGELVIYHGGHRGLSEARYAVIERFLDEGYAVLDVSMPMAGFNWSAIYHPPFGAYHEDIAYLDRPMRFFVEQLAVALNYLTVVRGFGDVYMVGISGGGWTTVVYAAIDPRIAASYSVAGSHPRFIREQLGKLGDFEQRYLEFYQHASYLDLYLLGAAGRRQVLVYNVFDDCCFAGTFSNTFKDHIRAEAGRLDGSFDVVLDDTFVGHAISPHALEIIVSDILAR